MKRDYLSKQTCLEEAARILSEGYIRNMSEEQIAREIYFHAVAYYCSSVLEKHHIPLTYFREHADPIDLQDGGDIPFRQFCFNVLWKFPSVR